MPNTSFSPTNSWQTFTVPSGVTSVTIALTGGQGGSAQVVAGTGYHVGGVPGRGAYVYGTASVTPGEVLYIAIGWSGNSNGVSGPNWSGGAGGDSRNAGSTAWVRGGYGGGATWIRRGSSSGTVLAVAGGGGGGGAPGYPTLTLAGGTGGASGQTGSAGGAGALQGTRGFGGGGATQSSGGSGGSTGGAAGIFETGGSAANIYTQFWGAGGGGGGGYYGGGAGGRDSGSGGGGGGGGGGSSYSAMSGTTYTANYQTGNGSVLIAWTDPVPVSSYTRSPSGTVEVNQTVNFTDQSTNNPTSWYWTFGDGTTSTQRHPSKSWSTPGTKSVGLTASNAGGSGNTYTTNISVIQPTPVSNFTRNPTGNVLVGQSVQFTDTSTNSPTSWSWNFGDSTTSTSQNPSKTWNSAGTYTVTLTASNAGGTGTQASMSVTVGDPPPVQTHQMLL